MPSPCLSVTLLHRRTHEDSMIMRSGLNLSLISTSVFSIRPTIVQHLWVSY